MKVARIVSQTKEYERLQKLIDNIEKAIEDIGKPQEKPKEFRFGGLTLMCANPEMIETVDAYLNAGVFELISDDLTELLLCTLNRLRIRQEELEV